MPVLGLIRTKVQELCRYAGAGLPPQVRVGGNCSCGNIYGAGDRNWSRIVPGTIRDFLQARRPVIRSDGTSVRDYLYVKDAVSAYLSLAAGIAREDVAGQAFNFSDEAPATVLEIVGHLQRLMKCEHLTPDVRNETRGEIAHQSVSPAKAKRVLGWAATHRRDEALADTISWYRTYLGTKRVKS